ncbi:MAG: hypothetical protein DBX91_09450 [Subdoligranulum variabile]|nr:MAG: hypothetical protein DBX91_09450 [Subdoligranulum variabile]
MALGGTEPTTFYNLCYITIIIISGKPFVNREKTILRHLRGILRLSVPDGERTGEYVPALFMPFLA